MSVQQPAKQTSSGDDSSLGNVDVEKIQKIMEPVVGTVKLEIEPAANRAGFFLRRPLTVADRLTDMAAGHGFTILRWALALVYVWFGVLKIIGHSDVFGLVAVTLPFLNPNVFVPILGVIEVLLGLALMTGMARRLVLAGIIGHLAGTFLTFGVAPGWMIHEGNPLLLNLNGEFVFKNLVLISTAIVLVGATRMNTKPRTEP